MKCVSNNISKHIHRAHALNVMRTSRLSKYKVESKRTQGQKEESGREICFPNFNDFQVSAYVSAEELLRSRVALNHWPLPRNHED
jgi:hypothetical protein